MNYFIGIILVALGIYLAFQPKTDPIKEKELFFSKYQETKAEVVSMTSSFMKPKWMTRVRYTDETNKIWEQDFKTNGDASYKVGDSITFYFNRKKPWDFIPHYNVNFESSPLSLSHIVFIFIAAVFALCWNLVKKTF